jgi:hypothetical protein
MTAREAPRVPFSTLVERGWSRRARACATPSARSRRWCAPTAPSHWARRSAPSTASARWRRG